jgi:hypothetical protein
VACCKTAPAKKSTCSVRPLVTSLENWRFVLVVTRLARAHMHGKITIRYLPQLLFEGLFMAVKRK